MEFSYAILGLVIFLAGAAIYETRRDPISNSRGWIPVAIGLILITVISFLLVPNYAGYISGAALVVFGILPSLGFRLSDRFFAQGKYKDALRLREMVRLVHPIHDWAWQRDLFRAYALVAEGEMGAAKAILEQSIARDKEPSAQHQVLVYHMTRDWVGLLEWWTHFPDRAQVEGFQDILAEYIRALGETGDLNKMLAEFERFQKQLTRVPPRYYCACLYCFAYCGRVEQVSRMLEVGVLQHIDVNMRTVWLAIAHAASGDIASAEPLVRSFQHTKDTLLRIPVMRILNRQIPLANQNLSMQSREILKSLEESWLTAIR